MKIPERHRGLTIGAVFTVCSIFLTGTFIVPILFAMPGAGGQSQAQEATGS
jgi:hypothetical protein